MINKDKREILDECVPDAIILDNESYDDSIIGYTDSDQIVYSFDRMVEEYMIENDCSVDDAIEWIEYNTVRAIPYMGDNKPIIMYSIFE